MSNVNQWVIDWMLDRPDEIQVCIIFSKEDVETLIHHDIHVSDWNKLARTINWHLPDDHVWEVVTELSRDLKHELDDLSKYEEENPSDPDETYESQ